MDMSYAWGTILIVVLGIPSLMIGWKIIPTIKKYGFQKAIIGVGIMFALIGFGIYEARKINKTTEPRSKRRGPMMWVESHRNNQNTNRILILFPPDPERDPDRWRQYIFQNPDNQQIWNVELKRVEKNGARLTELLMELRLDSKAEPVQVDLGIANNHQLKGIALRHLHRYKEALAEFSMSQAILESLGTALLCANASSGDECKVIRSLTSMTLSFFASVYEDLNDQSKTEKYLKLAVLASEDDSKGYPGKLAFLVRWYINKDDYDQALEVALQAIRSALATGQEYRIVGANKATESAYTDLFFSISWDPRTGMRREDDPNDFADMFGLGIGRRFKYGMVDPEEDEATFFTVLPMAEKTSGSDDFTGMLEWTTYESVEELKKNLDINAYVRSQMQQGNFEPAAKYLFFKYIDYQFRSGETGHLRCKNSEAGDVTFDEVKEALERTPSQTVSTRTKHTIELFDHGSRFLNNYCRDQGDSHGKERQTSSGK